MPLNNEILKGIGSIVAYASIALIPPIYKYIQAQIKKHSNYFSHNVKVRKQIDDIISEIRIHFHADRCVFIEFTNSDKTVNNHPFEFMTVTYEKTNGSVIPVKDQFQKQNITSFVHMLDLVTDDKPGDRILQIDGADTPDESSLAMAILNIKTCIIFRVSKSLKHGLISLHFLSDEYEQSWEAGHPDKRFLQIKATQILQLIRSLK